VIVAKSFTLGIDNVIAFICKHKVNYLFVFLNLLPGYRTVQTYIDPIIASHKLQTNLLSIQNWFKKWRMKANESKLIHITFTTRRETCPPPVHINNVQLPQEDVKYLGLHLDRRLTWYKHISAKWKQLGITFTKM
jgi:hypothetical protein